MLGIVIVHFNTPELLCSCVRSILADSRSAASARIVVVENGSRPAERSALHAGISAFGPAVELLDAGSNLGFAEGCNRGIDQILGDARVSHVLLLNSDAELQAGGLERLIAACGSGPAHMIAARVHRADRPDAIDSLGISMFSSGLASNRTDPAERLLGPTGGLAIYSRCLIDTLRSRHGYFFDPAFFCYAEDTDVAWRALLLGFHSDYLDECVALHHGQASSGGGFNDFVLYHGIRNSLWVLVKGFPTALLLRLLPRILILHCAIIVRHSLRGRVRVLARLYRDFLRHLPQMLRARRVVQATRTRPTPELRAFLSPHFYDRDYLKNALRDLVGRGHLDPRRD